MSRFVGFLTVAFLLALGFGTIEAAAPPHVAASSSLEAGKYLVVIAGCNHCHTQGWAATGGKVPQTAWLKGGHVPGPGGPPTPNLRAVAAGMSRTAFVAQFHAKQRPSAMPWVNLQHADTDLGAIYDFLRSLKT